MIRLKLREVLDQKGMSQMKLSRVSEVSLTTIQRMCNNPHYNPSIDVMDRLARALNVSVYDLYEQVPDKK
jgi:transcriptional regulator with XRE-family HTH domain